MVSSIQLFKVIFLGGLIIHSAIPLFSLPSSSATLLRQYTSLFSSMKFHFKLTPPDVLEPQSLGAYSTQAVIGLSAIQAVGAALALFSGIGAPLSGAVFAIKSLLQATDAPHSTELTYAVLAPLIIGLLVFSITLLIALHSAISRRSKKTSPSTDKPQGIEAYRTDRNDGSVKRRIRD